MFLPPATKLAQGYIFTGVCDSVHTGGVCVFPGGACVVARGGMHGCWGGGACMVARGVCVVARGCAWLPGGGGMCGCRGTCDCEGHAWLPGACMGGHAWLPGGMHGCQGACMGYEIQSMSGWYASYWNAFLLHVSVILFTGGVCPIACWDTHPPGPEAATPPPGTRHPPWDQRQAPPRTRHPLVQCMLEDTGNKRAVRILLECNLV